MTCGWLEARHGPDHWLFHESRISLKKHSLWFYPWPEFDHKFFSDNYRLTIRADDHPHSIKVLFS